MTIAALDQFLKDCDEAREMKRALAVKMALLGIPYRLISVWLNVSKSFITTCKKKFRQYGIIGLKLAYKGRKPYLTAAQEEEAISWLKSKNSWKFIELVNHIELKYKVKFKSKQSYYDLFKKAGISWKKTQKVNPKKDPERVKQKRNEIKKKLNELETEIKNEQVRVFFVDESHLRWGDVLGYVWGKAAERISVPIVNEKKRQTYYGALDIESKEVLVRPLAKGNSKCTIEFIKYLLKCSDGQRIVLIWDGASYHKSYELQDFLNEINKDLPPEKWRVTCILLAPHAPEQNPVEDVWLKCKNYLRQNFLSCASWANVKKLFLEATIKLDFDFNKLNQYREHSQPK